MTITIAGKKFRFNPLTRGQVKRLKSEGIDFSNLAAGDLDANIDAILEAAGVDIKEVDQLSYTDAMKLASAVMDATFLGPDAEKNSKRQSGSSRTDDSGTADPADAKA